MLELSRQRTASDALAYFAYPQLRKARRGGRCRRLNSKEKQVIRTATVGPKFIDIGREGGWIENGQKRAQRQERGSIVEDEHGTRDGGAQTLCALPEDAALVHVLVLSSGGRGTDVAWGGDTARKRMVATALAQGPLPLGLKVTATTITIIVMAMSLASLVRCDLAEEQNYWGDLGLALWAGAFGLLMRSVVGFLVALRSRSAKSEQIAAVLELAAQEGWGGNLGRTAWGVRMPAECDAQLGRVTAEATRTTATGPSPAEELGRVSKQVDDCLQWCTHAAVALQVAAATVRARSGVGAHWRHVGGNSPGPQCKQNALHFVVSSLPLRRMCGMMVHEGWGRRLGLPARGAEAVTVWTKQLGRVADDAAQTTATGPSPAEELGRVSKQVDDCLQWCTHAAVALQVAAATVRARSGVGAHWRHVGGNSPGPQCKQNALHFVVSSLPLRRMCGMTWCTRGGGGGWGCRHGARKR